MTDDTRSEDDAGDKPEIGTALTPAIETGINPFIAAAHADTPPPIRGLGARLLDYSAHAAIVIGLCGVAWTLSSRISGHPTTVTAPVQAASVAPQRVDELAQLRQANTQMAADLKSLHANLDALRAKTPGQIHALEAELTSTASRTDAQLAQLTGKLDKLSHQSHVNVDTTSTGSINPGTEPKAIEAKAAPVPVPPIKPTNAKLAGADDPKTILSGWVVRDVYDGVALIEGRHGPMEVVPGVSIPGAGVVKSIDRHGNGWTVTTTKGLLAYAAPPRDYRRVNARGYDLDDPRDY